jgi:hypothetical protein
MADELPRLPRPDPALREARLVALSGEIIRSYQAGLTPVEIAEIYLVDVAGVREVLASANVRPPVRRRWWLRPVKLRRDQRRAPKDPPADTEIA